MSLNSGAGASTPAAPSSSQPSASNPTTAAAAVSTNVNLQQAEASSATTISSLSDLKTKAPKIYYFMMVSIAQNMCIQMNRQNDDLIAAMKQMRDDDGS